MIKRVTTTETNTTRTTIRMAAMGKIGIDWRVLGSAGSDEGSGRDVMTTGGGVDGVGKREVI